MGDLTLHDTGGLLMTLLMERASETGRSPEDVAKEAMLRGLMRSPAERLAHADRIRAAARPPADGQPFEDSTILIRRLRDGE
ncbi:hypothetical protein [Methylobacterium planeticum]|uniref:Uncharacterized protein n=1 Tax=Methylobacterium planeticum TaxID=2615211 RepID=A0A6N6MVT2_9HYPH|nr:hypothetical protein [Methylobacterium planeticum]KAB1076007.1 hypothetical protein F6X51_00215 [Methylobacterium planeticum]